MCVCVTDEVPRLSLSPLVLYPKAFSGLAPHSYRILIIYLEAGK